MVKAIKRKANKERGESEAPVKEKTIKKSKKAMYMAILLLIVAGFTLSVPKFSQQQEEAEPTPGESVEYGTGSSLGIMNGTAGEATGNLAVFGQLDSVIRLKNDLDGDCYLINEGTSELLLTNASVDRVKREAKGNYIIYDIASCGEFDCLVERDEETPASNTANATSFEVYELNQTSRFLKTNKVGIPIVLYM